MITPQLLLAFHLAVPCLYWPVLWMELCALQGRLARLPDYASLRIEVTPRGRLHLITTPLPKTTQDLLRLGLQTRAVRFPLSAADAIFPLGSATPLGLNPMGNDDLRGALVSTAWGAFHARSQLCLSDSWRRLVE